MGEPSTPRRRLGARLLPVRPQAEVDEELAFHLEQRIRDNLARGMSPDEARRAAHERFGHVGDVREECAGLLAADRRGRARRERLRLSWLDFKLGFRMLLRYPGLTLVGGLTLAFAIAFGAASFEVLARFVFPSLPLPQGDRVVALRLWDADANRNEPRLLHDFERWRTELRTVGDVGATRTLQRNLITGDGAGEPVQVAEMTASGFRLTRVPPLLGRTLADADERPGAPAVMVIGHDVWQARFGGDPDVVGRTVRLGSTPHVVVGVMPAGYAFPVFHSVWTPLRLRALDWPPGEGPALSRVFGRLSPGATLDDARAELAALGRRAAADFPETHGQLRPEVLHYAKSFLELSPAESAALLSSNVLLVLFLLLVCGNVAMLLFARTATRHAEIVVRTALGASRARIVGQLFAEALVLGAVAAVLGLGAAELGLRWVNGVFEVVEGRLPFWMGFRVSPPTVVYTALLLLLVATVTGVVPALKVTRGLGERLREATAGGGGLRSGGVWTAVIVCQVALTVLFPATAFLVQRDAIYLDTLDAGVRAREYLTVRLELDRETAPGTGAEAAALAHAARLDTMARALEARLRGDARVAAVTWADRLPGMHHAQRAIEVEGGAAPTTEGDAAHRVGSATVAPTFFAAHDAPVIAGRAFHAADLADDARAVVVNQAFVERVLGGGNPIGRRVRFAPDRRAPAGGEAPPEPWLQVVGVVRDLGMTTGAPTSDGAGVYLPARPGAASPLYLSVRVRGDAATLAPRLRADLAALDPGLRAYDLLPLDRIHDAGLREMVMWFRLLLLVSGMALLLSLAGIHAVTAFTVARRTREIGIRVALGAGHRRIVAAIFARPLAHVTIGIALGALLTGTLLANLEGIGVTPRGVALLLAYAALMLGVCLLACVVPTRRALAVEPTEALRADG